MVIEDVVMVLAVQDHVNQFDVETSIKRMVVPEKILQVFRPRPRPTRRQTTLEAPGTRWLARSNAAASNDADVTLLSNSVTCGSSRTARADPRHAGTSCQRGMDACGPHAPHRCMAHLQHRPGPRSRQSRPRVCRNTHTNAIWESLFWAESTLRSIHQTTKNHDAEYDYCGQSFKSILDAKP